MDELKKCITFYGCDSQTGTTMTAVSAGEILAGRGFRVIVAALSGGEPEPLLEEGNGRVEILRGTDLEYAGFGEYEEMKTACSRLEAVYDWILLDCGSGRLEEKGRNGLKIGKRALLVVTQQEKCLMRFAARRDILEQLVPPDRLYVVNKFHPSGAFYTEKEMAERLEVPLKQIQTAAYVPYGWQAEKDGRTLLHCRTYRKDAEAVADWIEGGEGRGREPGEKGKGLRRLLSALPHDRGNLRRGLEGNRRAGQGAEAGT